jgi:hypothetical protein
MLPTDQPVHVRAPACICLNVHFRLSGTAHLHTDRFHRKQKKSISKKKYMIGRVIEISLFKKKVIEISSVKFWEPKHYYTPQKVFILTMKYLFDHIFVLKLSCTCTHAGMQLPPAFLVSVCPHVYCAHAETKKSALPVQKYWAFGFT